MEGKQSTRRRHTKFLEKREKKCGTQWNTVNLLMQVTLPLLVSSTNPYSVFARKRRLKSLKWCGSDARFPSADSLSKVDWSDCISCRHSAGFPSQYDMDMVHPAHVGMEGQETFRKNTKHKNTINAKPITLLHHPSNWVVTLQCIQRGANFTVQLSTQSWVATTADSQICHGSHLRSPSENHGKHWQTRYTRYNHQSLWRYSAISNPELSNQARSFDQQARLPWNIMKHHETSWNIMKHHETSWNIMKHHETSWNIMKHHETSWNIMKHHETSWNIMKHHETSWNIMKHHETSWNQPFASRSLHVYDANLGFLIESSCLHTGLKVGPYHWQNMPQTCKPCPKKSRVFNSRITFWQIQSVLSCRTNTLGSKRH